MSTTCTSPSQSRKNSSEPASKEPERPVVSLPSAKMPQTSTTRQTVAQPEAAAPKVMLTSPATAGIVALPVSQGLTNLTHQQLHSAGMEIVYVPTAVNVSRQSEPMPQMHPQNQPVPLPGIMNANHLHDHQYMHPGQTLQRLNPLSDHPNMKSDAPTFVNVNGQAVNPRIMSLSTPTEGSSLASSTSMSSQSHQNGRPPHPMDKDMKVITSQADLVSMVHNDHNDYSTIKTSPAALSRLPTLPDIPILNETSLSRLPDIHSPMTETPISPFMQSPVPNEDDEPSPTQFVSILKRMLSDESANLFRTLDKIHPLVSWSADGSSIIIRNSRSLFPQMMANFFTTTDINSFIRQLNHYGFAKRKRIEDQSLKARLNQDKTLEFEHPDFTRDNMCNLRRRKRNEINPYNPQKRLRYSAHMATYVNKAEFMEAIDEINQDKRLIWDVMARQEKEIQELRDMISVERIENQARQRTLESQNNTLVKENSSLKNENTRLKEIMAVQSSSGASLEVVESALEKRTTPILEGSDHQSGASVVQSPSQKMRTEHYELSMPGHVNGEVTVQLGIPQSLPTLSGHDAGIEPPKQILDDVVIKALEKSQQNQKFMSNNVQETSQRIEIVDNGRMMDTMERQISKASEPQLLIATEEEDDGSEEDDSEFSEAERESQWIK